MLKRKTKRGTETKGTQGFNQQVKKEREEKECQEVNNISHSISKVDINSLTFSHANLCRVKLQFTLPLPAMTETNTILMYLFLYFLYLSLLQVNPVLQLSNSLQGKDRHG